MRLLEATNATRQLQCVLHFKDGIAERSTSNLRIYLPVEESCPLLQGQSPLLLQPFGVEGDEELPKIHDFIGEL